VNEDALRGLVRDTIARIRTRESGPAAPDPSQPVDPGSFAGNFRYNLEPSADGSCVIEPAVRCNHCGYCLSYGH